MRPNLAPTCFDYSMKNIPITSKNKYLTVLIEKIESFIRRMRWKAFWFENTSEKADAETYGFKSEYAPPKNEKLTPFEDDLYDMIRNVQFDRVSDEFQNKLKQDAVELKKAPDLLVPADKSTNLYSLDKEQYDKLLRENVTKNYKKADSNTVASINEEAKTIVRTLNLEGKVQKLAEREAFITLKDHKENFISNPKCRLINPAKSEIGMVSKIILQKINSTVAKAIKLNQWRSTQDVLKWFKAIGNKENVKFIKFM